MSAVAAGLLLVAGGAGVYKYHKLSAPEHVIALVREGLSHLPCPASVEQATFTFFGGAEIVGLSIGPCGEAPSVPPIEGADAAVEVAPSTMTLRTASVRLVHHPWRLLLGKIQIKRIIIDAPVFDVVGDFKHAARPFKELRDKAGTEGSHLPEVLPAIEVQNGILRFKSPHRPESGALEQVQVNARALPSAARPGIYDVAWQTSAESGLLQYDLAANRLRDVRGGSPTVSIPAAMSAFSHRGKWAERWGRLAQLTGRIRVRDFDFSLRGVDVAPGTLVVEVAEASLAIPVAKSEHQLPPGDRLLSPYYVNGTADVRTDRIEVRMAGQWRGGPLRFVMLLPDGAAGLEQPGAPAFSMTIETDELRLPRLADATPSERRAISASPTVEQLYRELDPSGAVDLHVDVDQAIGGVAILSQLKITPRGASARPAVFPMPIAGITGEVEFTRRGVDVANVCGDHGGGTICVNGRFNGLDRCASAALSITGKSAPIDEDLYAALGPKLVRIRNWFDPAGMIDVEAQCIRDACQGGDPRPWTSMAEVTLRGIRAKYHDLPYEFEDLTGRLHIQENEFAADIAGRIGDAPVSAAGRIHLRDDDLASAEISVTAAELPIDSRLMQAVGPEIAERLAPFNLAGRVNVVSNIHFDARQDSLVHETKADLVNATVRHDGFPVPITNIAGPIRVGSQQIAVGPISGRYRGADLSLEGRIPSAGASDDKLKLSINVVNLRLDEELIAAAPQTLNDALRTWQIDGPLSGRVNLNGRRVAGGDVELTYGGEARLAGASIRHPSLPAPISAVSGLLTFDSSSLSGADLRGAYGRATLSGELQAYFSSDVQHGRLEFAATGIRIDDELLGVLPPAASARVRRMHPSGYMDAYVDRLQFTRRPGEAWEWSGAGSLRLHSLELPTLELSDVSGEVSFSGVAGDLNEGAMLAGEVRLDRAVLFDRELSRITTPWSLMRATSGIGELALDRIQGEVYGGDLSGRVELRFDARSSAYNLTALVQNMQLRPFLNAGSLPSVDATGRVAANIYLAGDSGDPQGLRGGGRFEVLDGDLYKLPVILAILSVLDITASPTDTFDEATADFYIVGRKVSVRDIALRGGLLALVGSGVVALPDLVVDLRLVNIPDQWWARLPLVAELMQGAVRELIQVRVTGPISQPTVRTDPVPRISDELRSLFQRRTTQRPLAPSR